VPVERWDVPVPPGYRLTRWIGTTPEDLLGSYAAARPAIRDAPHGENSYRETAWTAELIRQTERELADNGVEERVVVAIAVDTGEVAGVTGILNYPHRREFAYQNDTSVPAAHRGHGLGRVMKAAMMCWIADERPDIELVLTTTGADNTFMLDVNLAIGYETVRTMLWTETPTAKLAARLD
jgi:mycothiol synthase